VSSLPLTSVIAGEPPRPEFASAKSPASTPETFSLNLTVQRTLDALVGLASSRLIDWTVGAS
jgi:hypothetical protein